MHYIRDAKRRTAWPLVICTFEMWVRKSHVPGGGTMWANWLTPGITKSGRKGDGTNRMAIGSSRAMCHSEAGKLASQPKHDVATYTVCHTRLKKHNISFDMICPLLRISFYLYCPNLKNRLLVLKGFPKTHKYISSFVTRNAGPILTL